MDRYDLNSRVLTLERRSEEGQRRSIYYTKSGNVRPACRAVPGDLGTALRYPISSKGPALAFKCLAFVQEAPEDQEHWRNLDTDLAERVHAAKRARTPVLLVNLRGPGHGSS